MSKAFDRVECDYLEQIMYALDFHPKWIYLGMKFVNIVSFLVLIYGMPNGPINPSRCLRQGNSLFPYLFLFFIGGLINLLRRLEVDIKMYRRAPRLNHLLFAMLCPFL